MHSDRSPRLITGLRILIVVIAVAAMHLLTTSCSSGQSESNGIDTHSASASHAADAQPPGHAQVEDSSHHGDHSGSQLALEEVAPTCIALLIGFFTALFRCGGKGLRLRRLSLGIARTLREPPISRITTPNNFALSVIRV